jgi:uncharacterized membrane protein YfcA
MALAAIFTSAFAGAAGLGGGLMLLSMLPAFLPACALIPLHAVSQWFSNASRLGMKYREVDTSLIKPLFIGAIGGAMVGALLYRSFPLEILPPVLGLWILWLTWGPKPRFSIPQRFTFTFLGFYQSALSMALGATGSLGTALLIRHTQDREYVVINTAVYMSISHTCRVTAFIVLGFSFTEWWRELTVLILGTLVGTYIGTAIRPLINQAFAVKLLKGILTMLALNLVSKAAPLMSF